LVSEVSPDLLISDAIELVFQAQEAARNVEGGPHVVVFSGGPSDSSVEIPAASVQLDSASARTLTERIKLGFADPSILILEAHEGSAWRALGYRSWDVYARQELGLSRSRSYELLDHGRVLRALMDAAGLDALPEVSAYAAGQIKPRLGEAVADIRARIKSEPGERHSRSVVSEVVSRLRTELKLVVSRDVHVKQPFLSLEAPGLPTSSQVAVSQMAERSRLAQLHEAICFLMSLSDPAEVLMDITDSDRECLDYLHEAALRLAELANAWERSRSATLAPSPGPR
jgi:hypothetical protein